MGFIFETRGESVFLTYHVGDGETIDPVSLGMLVNNRIEGLAPMHYAQSDGEVYLRYNVTSKIAVKDFLAGEVNRRRLLAVLTGMADSAAAAEEYMLDSAMFVLRPEYVFVDVSSLEISVICLPVTARNAGEAPSLRDFLKGLVIDARYDVGESCDYVAGVINRLNSDAPLSMSGLREVAARLGGRGMSGPPPERAAPRDAIPANWPAAALAPARGADLSAGAETERQCDRLEPELTEIVEESADISLPYLLTHYSRKNRLLYRRGRHAAKLARAKTGPTTGSTERGRGAWNAQGFAIPGAPTRPAEPEPEPEPEQGRDFSDLAVFTGAVDRGLTTVLDELSAEATVVMGPGCDPDARSAGEPYLVRLRTNERITVDKQMFRIGKEPEYADYCIRDNAAISRSHAYIINRGGQFWLADTNSTNHTFIDGEMIPSGSEHVLSHGTRLQLASEEFKFFACHG
jgi:hypothetical protein